jgi:homoserine kinase type II
MRPPAEVLARYPAELARGTCEFLADAGGLSGARLWRLRTPLGDWCLKAWPAASTAAEQLNFGHRLMAAARRAGLTFVPQVLATDTRVTYVAAGPWLWDVVSWQPGEPARRPTEQQLSAAGRALARLHVAWQEVGASHGPCPGVLRRLDALKAAENHVWGSENDELLAALGSAVRRLAPGLVRELERWRSVALPLSPCLCDVRREHVLFRGDEVTGVIDFGAARIDHPAGDLSRFLGETLGGNTASWRPFLDAYNNVRSLSPVECELIPILESAGAVASAAFWLRGDTPKVRLPQLRRRWQELHERLSTL